VLTSQFLVTRVQSTNIVVITVNCIVLASLMFIANISCACILVITNYRSVSASCCRIAIVVRTSVIIVTINWNVRNNSSYDVTFFSCASVTIAQLFWSRNAALDLIANIISARIVISACFGGVDASFYSVTTVNCASIIIVTIESSILTSQSWTARVYCASVAIVTILLFTVITNSVIAFVDAAKIVISACYSSVNTFVGCCIAFVNGASITVITIVDIRAVINDLSSCSIARVVFLALANSGWNLETSLSHIFQTHCVTFAS
jgi:hypothetical protein